MVVFSLGNGIGIKIGNQTILLDPKISDFISFISHAHSDHSPQVIIKKPYCTQETYELIKIRNPEFEANIVRENEKIEFDGFSVRLISSGHILGSTQTLIETESNSILYTGDFKISKGLTGKKIEIKRADTLILESTYGLPTFVFPSIKEVRKSIIDWVLEQNDAGLSVMIGGYTVGKSQEVVKLLNKEGIVPSVSSSIRKYCEIYNSFGSNLEFFEEQKTDFFVVPMHVAVLTKKSRTRKCIVTGWSVIRDFGVKGFPMSDHCDFNQLLKFVEKVGPERVCCVHGFAKELAMEIERRLGIKATALQKNEQKQITDF
ncbi:MAG: MBL fold metallo-hydrolase [Candidatus Aenigmatarchaeota archaeon]